MFPAATFKVWSPTSKRIHDQTGLNLIPDEIGSGSVLIRDEIANLGREEIAFGHQDMSVSFQDRAMVRKSKKLELKIRGLYHKTFYSRNLRISVLS